MDPSASSHNTAMRARPSISWALQCLAAGLWIVSVLVGNTYTAESVLSLLAAASWMASNVWAQYVELPVMAPTADTNKGIGLATLKSADGNGAAHTLQHFATV